MACAPMASVEVEKFTVPEVPKETLPREIAPSSNRMFPVGAPAPGLTTESDAVKVTFCPNATLIEEGVRVTVVAAWLTDSATAADVLEAKVASPLYVAAIRCEPGARENTLKVAWPLLIGAEPRLTPL